MFSIAGETKGAQGDRSFTWQLQMSLAALIFYSSLFGGAIIALLALPRLIDKHFHAKKLNKGVYELKKKIVELEKEHGR